jgi:NitT/TauT family transport system substrate-binding protein
MVFRIQPHMRLHEWVADEVGFFRDEGLDYEFETNGFAASSAIGGAATGGRITPAGGQPGQILSGAFEDMAQGRSSDVSCACHWAVNAASASRHGRMYGQAYSVCPSGIFVAPGSPYEQPADLANVDVSVGYHSGSHYSAIQALEPFLSREEIKLHFAGLPNDRLRLLLEGRIPAANVWGAQYYLLEQQGFRKLVDTTFVMGFLVSLDARREDVDRYCRALLRAQQEIDFAPERYKHFWLKEMPPDLRDMADVRRFGPGERIVPQPYTRQMYDRTYRWMEKWDLIDTAAGDSVPYDEAVLA